MMNGALLPKTLSPVNIQAYLFNNFGVCGCTEIESVVEVIVKLLEWHGAEMSTRERYDELFDLGVFYILAGLLDHLNLTEHGSSIRHPWLTEDGKRLLEAFKTTSIEDISSASGEAYDGLHY